jgi:hypothetical protein
VPGWLHAFRPSRRAHVCRRARRCRHKGR